MKESEEEFSVTTGYTSGVDTASSTTITTTDGSAFTIGDLLTGDTVNIQDGSGLTWNGNNITTAGQTTYDTNWGSIGGSNTTWTNFPIEPMDATKEELQKIIKNREVQIEIDGVMKKCKLSDLLETGYLTLKSL